MMNYANTSLLILPIFYYLLFPSSLMDMYTKVKQIMATVIRSKFSERFYPQDRVKHFE